jgi:ABC-type transport system involved in multi-copper enzyme maturation permease subunit
MRNLSKIARQFKLDWLTGPIFDKELRVSSRRKWNYSVRFIYLILLILFIVLVWLANVRMSGSNLFRVSRMSEAGIYIMMTIVLFQFFATQILSIVMLSNSISDEIYHRTLGVLMTTPINSFQIVMGKLASKMLQILLLLAISLPLMAVVRVFGGVPWDYVVSSVCITLTGALFAGSVSLYFSIGSKRAYAVIIKTIFGLLGFYGLVPMIIGLIVQDEIVLPYLMYINPLLSVYLNTALMMVPRGMGFLGAYIWWVHCLIMLALTALIIARSVVIVRRAALRSINGESDGGPVTKAPVAGEWQNSPAPVVLKRVKGSPIVWKECRVSLWKGWKKKLSVSLTIILLLFTYLLVGNENELNDRDTHIIYVLVFFFLGIVSNAIMAATTITSEKESRSWPILMVTTLSDFKIVLGKAVGLLRRCYPIWLLLAGHVLIFTCVGYIHPAVFFHLSIIVIGIILFLCGSGLYFSTRLKRTTTAVMSNAGLALGIWALLPLLAGLFSLAIEKDDPIEFIGGLNPFVQIAIITEEASGTHAADLSLDELDYDLPFGFDSGFGATTCMLLCTSGGYILLGFLFAMRAKRRLRRHIF